RQGGDGLGAHAHDADVVGQSCKRLAGFIGVHHVSCGVGIADKQRFIQVAASGIRCFGQYRGGGNGGGLGGSRRGRRRRHRGGGGFNRGGLAVYLNHSVTLAGGQAQTKSDR